MPTPEDKAREKIDQALQQAGWLIQDIREVNLHVGRGVAIRNFPLVSGHGFADYLLYIDGKAAGVVEAKKEGFPLVGVEVQAVKYSEGLPSTLPAYIHPLPFLYQSTGIEPALRTASTLTREADGPLPFIDPTRWQNGLKRLASNPMK